jgi:hypothetical protein
MSVDLSAQGITTRLKRVSQLRQLCLSLGKAKLVNHKMADSAVDKRQAGKKASGNQGQ